MQLGSIARLWKRAPRAYLGDLFTTEIVGRGDKDLVLVHGLAASPETWDRASEALPDGVRLHLVHIRGFAGEAPAKNREPGNFLKPFADELAAYIRLHARGRASVAGHSMGGLACLMLARDHAAVVERLMVVDVPAFFSVLINPFATVGAMTHLAEASRRRYVENDPVRFEEDLTRTADQLVKDPIARARVVHWGMLSDRAQTADIMAEVMVTDLRGDLRAMRTPTEIVYAWDRAGHHTRVGVDQVYSSAYGNMPNKTLTRIDDARHYAMFDQPEVFYRTMREWLGR